MVWVLGRGSESLFCFGFVFKTILGYLVVIQKEMFLVCCLLAYLTWGLYADRVALELILLPPALHLPSAGMTGVCHDARLSSMFFVVFFFNSKGLF